MAWTITICLAQMRYVSKFEDFYGNNSLTVNFKLVELCNTCGVGISPKLIAQVRLVKEVELLRTYSCYLKSAVIDPDQDHPAILGVAHTQYVLDKSETRIQGARIPIKPRFVVKVLCLCSLMQLLTNYVFIQHR